MSTENETPAITEVEGYRGRSLTSTQEKLRDLLKSILEAHVESTNGKVDKLSSVQKACISELGAIREILDQYLEHPDMTDVAEETVRLVGEAIHITSSLSTRLENVDKILADVERIQNTKQS
jgi:hypothetical protein